MDENATHDDLTEDDIVEVEDTNEDFDTVSEYDMTADDALAVILSAKPIHQIRRVGIPAREGMGAITVTLRSLSDREFKQLRKASEAPTGKKGTTEVDDTLFLRNVVAAAITEPKISDIKVRQALGVQRPYEVVEKLFLPGRIGQLAEKVMELSGWDEEGIVDLGN